MSVPKQGSFLFAIPGNGDECAMNEDGIFNGARIIFKEIAAMLMQTI